MKTEEKLHCEWWLIWRSGRGSRELAQWLRAHSDSAHALLVDVLGWFAETRSEGSHPYDYYIKPWDCILSRSSASTNPKAKNEEGSEEQRLIWETGTGPLRKASPCSGTYPNTREGGRSLSKLRSRVHRLNFHLWCPPWPLQEFAIPIVCHLALFPSVVGVSLFPSTCNFVSKTLSISTFTFRHVAAARTFLSQIYVQCLSVIFIPAPSF